MNEFVAVGSKWRRKHGNSAGNWSSPAMQWAVSDALHASWAFLAVASQSTRDAYPLKVVDDLMYLSATVVPVPTYSVPSEVVASRIDLYQENSVEAGSEVIMQAVDLFHFNLKTLAKQSKRECYQRQLAPDRVFMATFAETRARVTEVRTCGK